MEPTSSLKVLFLEDDPDTRIMVTVLLRESDIDVAAVDTPREAMVMAGVKPFNAFLLDGIVPNGDSFRLCRILKSRFPDRPVIFYSGLSDAANKEKAMAAGASFYLVKPYLGDLARLLTQAVRDATSRPIA